MKPEDKVKLEKQLKELGFKLILDRPISMFRDDDYLRVVMCESLPARAERRGKYEFVSWIYNINIDCLTSGHYYDDMNECFHEYLSRT